MNFTAEQARQVWHRMGIRGSAQDFEQFHRGMNEELEHADVTGGDPWLTAKIAIAHLISIPDYYTRLAAMEAQAKKDWGLR